MGLLQPWHLPPFSYESQHIVFKVKKRLGTGTDATDEFTRSHWIDIMQNETSLLSLEDCVKKATPYILNLKKAFE